MTTIALTKKARNQIKQFGSKGDTYSDIVQKLVKYAEERQLHDLLMSSKNTITIEEARKRLNRKWPKSK